VYATGAVTLTDYSGATVAELADGDVAHCVSLGDGAWSAVGRDKFTRVIDFRLYGTPDDEDYDNTPALEEALADAYEAGGAAIWFGGGREWWFLTALDSNSATTYRHYENVALVGIAPEFTCQHQEAPGVGIDLDNTFGTRLRFNLTAGETWWDVQRDYRFGPLRIENLSWQTATRINLFGLGQEGDILDGSFRGLYVKACVFSCNDPDGVQNDWISLADGPTPDDGLAGYVLPPASYAFNIVRGYDVLIEDCTFRGWSGCGIRTIAGDRAMLRNCRSINCQIIEDLHIVDESNVPSVLESCYVESFPYYGIVTSGAAVSSLRAEVGYNSTFTPDIGPYALPAGITWDIAVGDNEIIFDGFEDGYDATDYFRRGFILELEATEEVGSTIPPRQLCVLDVTETSVVFYNHASSSYVGTALSGDGTQLTRLFGICLVMIGDRCSLNGFTMESNETTNIPIYAFVPGKKTVEVVGNSATIGQSETATPTAYAPIVIASSAGGVDSQWGGLKVISRHNAPNHPSVYYDEGPAFAQNYRGPIWDEATESQIFLPGRGVGASTNVGRDLKFRKIADSELGIDVWVYLLTDAPTIGWELRPIRKNNVAADYVIRCYASQNTTLTVNGGEGSDNEHPLTTGWHTISGASHGDTATLAVGQMLADGHGPKITLGGAFISVAKVTVTQ
jgi:hypothetical protein